MSDYEPNEFEAVSLSRQAAINNARRVTAGQGQVICQTCGDEISELRREAMPSARNCILCQEELESGHGN